MGLTRDDLQRSNEKFLIFQTLVLQAQMEAEAVVVNAGLLTDRSIFDPLAYAVWRFGLGSMQVWSKPVPAMWPSAVLVYQKTTMAMLTSGSTDAWHLHTGCSGA